MSAVCCVCVVCVLCQLHVSCVCYVVGDVIIGMCVVCVYVCVFVKECV